VGQGLLEMDEFAPQRESGNSVKLLAFVLWRLVTCVWETMIASQ
jgi:hypothetical protein